MQRYNPKVIEPKWQKIWEDSKIYQAKTGAADNATKRYVLEYFPYPSGAAMHVGHVRNYTIGDAVARYSRMRGYNVLHPMGWDSFGLPAENYAIKTGISPRKAIDDNTSKFKKQLMQMGFSYDWSREIDSSDPQYYKWTQWFFKLLFERGLAYQAKSMQWWCPECKTVLANEQVENGYCWRHDNTLVIKKATKQWFFKITEYADRLLDDLDNLDWSDSIKTMQRNWIGKSDGAKIKFALANGEGNLEVFTTAHDTIFGTTFMVLAPEHPLVMKLTSDENKPLVKEYIEKSAQKNNVERLQEDKDKTGVFTGGYVINPANGQEVPVWVADYVLMDYGEGAIMAVPGQDERDYEFAKKYDLPIICTTDRNQLIPYAEIKQSPQDYKLSNSQEFDGLDYSNGRTAILEYLVDKKVAEPTTQYKIRDWLISRQRYWGAPIPIIHCKNCGVVSVPDEDLPVELPEVEDYAPTGNGSVLESVTDWVKVECPKCQGPARRETDTMDGFACSSWYFLRFADPHNNKMAFDKDKAEYWLPVDDYIGGAEHAVMHLLYARFWTKVMFDAGLINYEEPFLSLRNQGMILAPDGQKMSKSKGNTIEPDELIESGYGADSIRIMELFIGPWNQSANWSVQGIAGTFRFIQRVWSLVEEYIDASELGQAVSSDNQAELEARLVSQLHKTIKKVTKDFDNLSFNTAIAACMEFVKTANDIKGDLPMNADSNVWREVLQTLLQLLAPFAPHVTEELWKELGHDQSIHISAWPKWDEELVKSEMMTIVIQVNGKVRANLEVAIGTDMDEIVTMAQAIDKVNKYLDKPIKKTIKVPNKLVNFVV